MPTAAFAPRRSRRRPHKPRCPAPRKAPARGGCGRTPGAPARTTRPPGKPPNVPTGPPSGRAGSSLEFRSPVPTPPAPSATPARQTTGLAEKRGRHPAASPDPPPARSCPLSPGVEKRSAAVPRRPRPPHKAIPLEPQPRTTHTARSTPSRPTPKRKPGRPLPDLPVPARLQSRAAAGVGGDREGGQTRERKRDEYQSSGTAS